MMKIYARTNEKSFLNNNKGEAWTEVKLGSYYGREVVRFPSGFNCKIERCEVVYVFDKEN